MADPDKVEKIIAKVMKMVEGFSVDDLMELRFELEERLQTLRESAASTPSVEAEPKRTVKEEYRKCGKPGCQCRQGKLHGPYLYEYWKEDNRTRSRYIGKEK